MVMGQVDSLLLTTVDSRYDGDGFYVISVILLETQHTKPFTI